MFAKRAFASFVVSTCGVVDRTGQMHVQPWGGMRAYQYGAPLGIEQLFADMPPIGLT